MRPLLFLMILLFASSCSNKKEPQRDAEGRVLKNGQFYDAKEAETKEVWICLGTSSHAYHSTNECYGIQACEGKKKKVSLDEAVSMGRTPCHYCHELTEKEDDNNEVSYDVYICPGGSGTKYHRKNCSSLKRCKGNIERMEPEEAEDLGYQPCSRCCK